MLNLDTKVIKLATVIFVTLTRVSLCESQSFHKRPE